MSKLFSKIGQRIEKIPFKTLLAFILIFAILITGAIKVNMATGNETLVQTDNEAYISNHAMEKDFGGDAIMVLLQGESEDLLSQNNIEKMWNVEERLKYNEGIFSFMSPASIVHQITDKQTNTIKENVLTMSDGLGQMSEKLIEIGNELASKDLPDPKEIEDKLNSMMSDMEPSSIMDKVMEEQKTELEAKMLPMSDGLGHMGYKLTDIGSELASKDLPNPKAMENKLNSMTSMMSPDGPIFKEMEKDSQEMIDKIQNMGDGLGEMGSQLTEIAASLGGQELPDLSQIEEIFKELSGMTDKFDELKNGQDNIGKAAEGLGGNLANFSIGLEEISKNLGAMAGQVDGPMQAQLNEISSQLGQMSGGLSEASSNTGMISEGSGNTSNALTMIGSELQNKLDEMQEGLPGSGGVDQGKLEDLSKGLTFMGNQLSMISEELSDPSDMMPDSSGALEQMQSKMEKEISEMEKGLSGGIDPEELKTMSGGFETMGANLNQLSSGITQMIQGGDMLPDTTDALSGITNQMESNIEEMKANLDGGISPEDLKTMADGFVTIGENLGELSEGLETFYDKSGMLIANIPHNQKELDNILYEDNGKLRDIFSDTIVDDNHLMMMIKLEGNLKDSDKDTIYEEVAYAMEQEEFEDVDYIVSGKPVLDSSLRAEMKSNMQYMVVLAAVIMLVVLFLVFKVRWRLLSLGVILVSVIGTLGLMGHLNVSMTMVSMAVFPILIGLGIDYSIQFHNRYEEELSVTKSLSQIGRAVAIAVIATMLGFISLYASPVPMIQDFGKMLTIGVVASFMGSIFLLMPVLNLRDLFNPKSLSKNSGDSQDNSLMGRFLGGTANIVTKFAPLVLVVVTILAGLGLYADQKVGVETDIETFMPQDMDALEDIRYVRDLVGSTDQMVIYMEDDDILSEENISWMQSKVQDIENRFTSQVEDVKSINNLVENFSDDEDLSHGEYMEIVNDIPENQRSMFVNEDRDKGVIIINIRHMATDELQEFVKDINQYLNDAPMDLSITGKSVLDVEMVKGLTGGRIQMTLLGIGLVFMALLIIYRSFFKALIPVFPIILIVGMSGGIMYLLGLNYTPITATLGALILGMGTEMTIMVLERYLEERNGGKDKAEAMSITVNRIGKATLASGLTTVGGFSVLMLSKFVILKDFGLMTVINVSLALISTFVILPAVIWVLDRFIVKEKVK